jgi:hypothetical protein
MIHEFHNTGKEFYGGNIGITLTVPILKLHIDEMLLTYYRFRKLLYSEFVIWFNTIVSRSIARIYNMEGFKSQRSYGIYTSFDLMNWRDFFVCARFKVHVIEAWGQLWFSRRLLLKVSRILTLIPLQNVWQ